MGDRCLAVWDGLWYRAVVEDVINDDIKVSYTMLYDKKKDDLKNINILLKLISL